MLTGSIPLPTALGTIVNWFDIILEVRHKSCVVQADQQTGDNLLLLRNQVNLVLEQARRKRLLGSALEAKVLLHVADATEAESLKALNGAANGADPLRYAFITSQAQLVASQVSIVWG